MPSLNFYYKSYFFLLCAILLLTSSAFAQNERHIPPRKILAFSLQSLKSSAHQIFEKNTWLTSTNNTLRLQILTLQKELQSLKNLENQFLLNKQTIIDQQKLIKESNAIAYESLNNQESYETTTKELQEKHTRIKAKILLEEKRKDDIKRQINTIQQEITQLNTQIKPLNEKNKIKIGRKEEEHLLKTITQTKNNLAKTKKKLAKLKKQYTKPIKIVKTLSDKKNLLTQRILPLENKLQTAEEKRTKIIEEIQSIEDKNKLQISLINDEINKLKTRDGELNKILSEARKKLSNPHLTLSNRSYEERILKENLTTILKENTALKKELTEY